MVWWHRSIAWHFYTVTHDDNALGRNIVALDLNLFVGLVCRNNAIREAAGKPLEQDQCLVHDLGAVREPSPIHLRGQIVMSNTKRLSKKFKNGTIESNVTGGVG